VYPKEFVLGADSPPRLAVTHGRRRFLRAQSSKTTSALGKSTAASVTVRAVR
jgi:hypothetical protein